MDSIFWHQMARDFSLVMIGAAGLHLIVLLLFERAREKNPEQWNIGIPRNVQQDSFGTNSAFGVQHQATYLVDCDYWDVPEGDQPCWQL
jgi:hypothetical protein